MPIIVSQRWPDAGGHQTWEDPHPDPWWHRRGAAAGRALAARDDCNVLLSLAGRTEKPATQPVPVRIGGFGGAAALADFLKAGGYDLLIDATHPFAERISANAAFAAETTGIAAIALRRPEWQRRPGDRWQEVRSIPAAIEALGPSPAKSSWRRAGRAHIMRKQHRNITTSSAASIPSNRHLRLIMSCTSSIVARSRWTVNAIF